MVYLGGEVIEHSENELFIAIADLKDQSLKRFILDNLGTVCVCVCGVCVCVCECVSV